MKKLVNIISTTLLTALAVSCGSVETAEKKPLVEEKLVSSAAPVEASILLGGELSKAFTYELASEKPWVDAMISTTTYSQTRVRLYVPGGRGIRYRYMTIATTRHETEANSLGDSASGRYSVYGGGSYNLNPFDGPQRSVSSNMLEINDDRYAVTNGYRNGQIYDIEYNKYVSLNAPDGSWTSLRSINNLGQVVGRVNAASNGFVYDCATGFSDIEMPGATSTQPFKVDDQGNVYGRVSGLSEAYFIARPTTESVANDCSLTPRDDTFEALTFSKTNRFEMSGDAAQRIKIGDFDGGGKVDLLVMHEWETGKTILYTGESNFKEKVKNGYNINNEVDSADPLDINGDGIADLVQRDGSKTTLSLAKEDGSFHFVPQTVGDQNTRLFDMNGDGLADLVTHKDEFFTIKFQDNGSVTPEPEPTPEPNPEPIPEPTGSVEVEMEATILLIGDGYVVLTGGKILSFGENTILKLNDADALEVGQTLEFKAWQDSSGNLLGIKVEVI